VRSFPAPQIIFYKMPTSLAQVWFPVLVQAILAMVIAAALVTLTFVIGRKVKNKVKDMPYECGIAPTGDARQRFTVKFYLVAMLFILFDIEAIFLYPWAVVYKQLKMFGFLEMLTFVVLILAGFFFIWKKGVLDWAHNEDTAPRRPVTVRLNLTPVRATPAELAHK
jgi:NADH-quinone oxidoreductase subunit A